MHLFFFALSSSILATNSVAYAAAAAAADLQSARHVLAFMPNYGLAVERRQVIECASVEPGPQFCERSCGPLFTSCVIAESCYAPSLGQTCCESAEYCPAGTYCTTLGCCLNGSNLADCDANLASGDTTIAPSVPGTLFSTMSRTLVSTNPLVATTTRLRTSSLIASSNSAVPTLSSPSVSSPTSAAATLVSTSPTDQTSGTISELPSSTRTPSITLSRTTSSGTTALNSGSKNSKGIVDLISGLLGFLLMLW